MEIKLKWPMLVKFREMRGLFVIDLILVYSDDGERVKFFNDCNLEGAVEIWLSRLLEFHCETIRNWLRVAVTAYEV
jgi:hypothetical protein